MNITITETKSASQFISSDLALVTAITLFHPFETIDRQNPRKAQFIFIRNSQLDELIEKYWKKELLVEPRQYFDQLRAIKNQLYSNG
ncbi:MAG: DUF5659 domain-containing protein [bacterium]|nr:DUF5659 domain-containing protein [bacterium]